MRLPDPGRTLYVAPRRWRVVAGYEPVVARLSDVGFEALATLEGMQPLRSEAKLFWGRLSVAGRSYFVKCRRLYGVRRRLATVWRTAPLRREWRLSWWAYEHGIPTAQPVAVGLRRRWGLVEEGILLTHWLEGVEDFDAVLARALAAGGTIAARAYRRYAYALGALCGRLHTAGAVHRQLHGRNVLVEHAGTPEERLVLVDLMHLGVFEAPLLWRERAIHFYQLAFYLREPIVRSGAGRRVLLAFVRGYVDALAQAGERGLRPAALLRWLLALWPARPLERRPRRAQAQARWRALGAPAGVGR